MNSPLRLRLLTRADLAFADLVRALAGWNQTTGDWVRFLDSEPDGCFLAEWNGTPAGTATTTVYGPDLAWVGMLLVHPDYRRRGIGRALLEHCLEYLRKRKVRCVKLDATPLGKPVYDALGFQDEWTLARWAREPLGINQSTHIEGIRKWDSADAVRIRSLDTQAFGVARERLLMLLAPQSQSFICESPVGNAAGYGFVRSGSLASYVGPVVAIDACIGIRLLERIISARFHQPLYWDIPESNTAAIKYAQEIGFRIQRPLVRMYLGENVSPGCVAMQFALGGPEIG